MLYKKLLVKYTGWCQNDFNVQGYSSLASSAAGDASAAAKANRGRAASAAAKASWSAAHCTVSLCSRRRAATARLAESHLGSGRIVASEIEAPSMLANLV